MQCRGNNSCLHFPVHSRDQFHFATMIKDPDPVTIGNAPRLRID